MRVRTLLKELPSNSRTRSYEQHVTLGWETAQSKTDRIDESYNRDLPADTAA